MNAIPWNVPTMSLDMVYHDCQSCRLIPLPLINGQEAAVVSNVFA